MRVQSAVALAEQALGPTVGYSVLHRERWVKTLRYVTRLCPPGRFPKLIDVGVWPGYQSLALVHLGYRVHGLDLDPTRLASLPLTIDQYDLLRHDSMPVESGRYDVIVATEIIEHIPPERLPIFLTAASAALRPGGYLIISTPNRRYLGNMIRSRATGTDAAGHGHTHEYSRGELRRVVSTGWVDQRVTPVEMYALVGTINPRQYYRPLWQWWRQPRKLHNILRMGMAVGQLVLPGQRDTLMLSVKKP